jgi:hypothetical protein
MGYKTVRDVAEWLFVILLVVGIATAALNATIAGFTPTVWLLLALMALVLIICTEVSRIREFLLAEKESEKPRRRKA